MTRRRALLLCAAVLCAGSAAVLALLARDVGRREAAMRAGDAAAVAGPREAEAAWSVDETLPSSPARALLGIRDDLDFRRAAMLFRRAYVRIPSFDRSLRGSSVRLTAETELAHVLRTERDRRRASVASNLLAILAFVDAASTTRGDISVDRSIFEFQDAIRLDPRNEQAKANLELVFQQHSLPFTVRGRERLQRSAHAGASASSPGHGY